MCGRYVIAAALPELAAFLAAGVSEELAEQFHPSWNVPPTASVPALTLEHGERRLGRFDWGLIPPWAKQRTIGARTFNARAESVATKPTFRSAFFTRRCLVPAAPGFYEWSRGPVDRKTPYLFERVDGDPMVFAGLWEVWRPGPGEAWTRSCTIITAPASSDVAPVHDRQPVLLERDAWDRWLDPALRDRDELEAMLIASPPGTMRRYEVSRDVGSTRNDSPDLTEPVASSRLL